MLKPGNSSKGQTLDGKFNIVSFIQCAHWTQKERWPLRDTGHVSQGISSPSFHS